MILALFTEADLLFERRNAAAATQRAHPEPRNVPLRRAGVPHISLSSQIALRSISPPLSPFSLFSPSDEKIPSSWSFLYSPGARATIRRIAPAVGTSVLWARYAQGGPFDPQLQSYVYCNYVQYPKHESYSTRISKVKTSIQQITKSLTQ